MKTPKTKQTAIEEEAAMREYEDCRVTDQMFAYIGSIDGKTSCLLTGARGTAEWAAENDAINAAGMEFAAGLGIEITERHADGWTGVQSLDGTDGYGAPARTVYVVSKRNGPNGPTIGISYVRHVAW